MSTLMTLGAAAFFAGGLTFMSLLFSSGGWQRSKQFAVISQLWSGQHGRARKLLCRACLGLIGTGAVLCFAGVAQMDAERAARCESYCVDHGYQRGAIGPSADRSPANRYVACICASDIGSSKEVRADTIKR